MPGGERNVEGAEIGEEGVEELKVAGANMFQCFPSSLCAVACMC